MVYLGSKQNGTTEEENFFDYCPSVAQNVAWVGDLGTALKLRTNLAVMEDSKTFSLAVN